MAEAPAEGDPASYDPIDESWEEAKPRLLASKTWRYAPAALFRLALRPAQPIMHDSRLPSDRVPTQAELNTATKDVVGHIICVSGHGVGKVVEFLDNGSFGVKSGHMIEFGDPFDDGSESMRSTR